MTKMYKKYDTKMLSFPHALKFSISISIFLFSSFPRIVLIIKSFPRRKGLIPPNKFGQLEARLCILFPRRDANASRLSNHRRQLPFPPYCWCRARNINTFHFLPENTRRGSPYTTHRIRIETRLRSRMYM